MQWLEKERAQWEAERRTLSEECKRQKDERVAAATDLATMEKTASQFILLCRTQKAVLDRLMVEREAVRQAQPTTTEPKTVQSMAGDAVRAESAKSGNVPIVRVGDVEVPQMLYESIRSAIAAPLVQEYEGKFAQRMYPSSCTKYSSLIINSQT